MKYLETKEFIEQNMKDRFDTERGIFILLLSVLDVCFYLRFYGFYTLAILFREYTNEIINY